MIWMPSKGGRSGLGNPFHMRGRWHSAARFRWRCPCIRVALFVVAFWIRTEVAVSKNKKLKKHRALSYESSNTKVITVTKKGKVKAVGLYTFRKEKT